MRLLHVKELKLYSFEGSNIPEYAILSHTWGDDEVLFSNIHGHETIPQSTISKKGWNKILGACSKAKYFNLIDYIWIDTCCIDKSSSASFQRPSIPCSSITPMLTSVMPIWKMYGERNLCWSRKLSRTQDGSLAEELIAPRHLEFFNKDWRSLGTKRELQEWISERTKIDPGILQNPWELSTRSIARRMSWASNRVTTRKEDIAYCLLGLFGINMPLLYGEGAKAFIRLQEEIIKNFEDESIFAWDTMNRRSMATFEDVEYSDLGGILAPSPDCFADSFNIVPGYSKNEPYVMTNRDLRMELAIIEVEQSINTTALYGLLICHYEHDETTILGIPIKPHKNSESRYWRRVSDSLVNLTAKQVERATVGTVYIHKSD